MKQYGSQVCLNAKSQERNLTIELISEQQTNIYYLMKLRVLIFYATVQILKVKGRNIQNKAIKFRKIFCTINITLRINKIDIEILYEVNCYANMFLKYWVLNKRDEQHIQTE